MIKQNLRLKENKNNTFKPEINNKSKYLGEKKRQSSETNERFEDLYQEYKIISEKRNQLRLKLDKQYSFAPNLCQNRKIQDSSNFLERLTEDIKKRQAKRSSEEENQYEPLPTFCPQITKNIVDSSRNIDKLPIGEYLYKMSNQIKERQTDLRETADKELKTKAPKCTKKSAQIIRMKIKNNLERIFESLDIDKVGFISAEHLKHVPKEIIKVLGPLFEELKQTNSRIDLQQFTLQCEKLLKVADPTIKSYLMTDLPKQASKENNKFYQELELAFHPNINKKSKEIADAEEERQGRSVYQRLYSERAKSEMRLRELKEKSATNELRECSFQPVINKYSGCTEAFYQKIFSQAQEN